MGKIQFHPPPSVARRYPPQIFRIEGAAPSLRKKVCAITGNGDLGLNGFIQKLTEQIEKLVRLWTNPST